MPLLEIPPPYDFELSTERYRAFGPDLANLWHDGGFHRVIAGREVRITAAEGGVDVDPLDREIAPVVRHLLGLARSGLDLDGLAMLSDADVKARLVAQRGVGEWTADWFLARHLARPEAWPWGDLGLRKAVAAFYGADEDVNSIGARFAPFQNLTAHYLLTGLRVSPPGD